MHDVMYDKKIYLFEEHLMGVEEREPAEALVCFYCLFASAAREQVKELNEPGVFLVVEGEGGEVYEPSGFFWTHYLHYLSDEGETVVVLVLVEDHAAAYSGSVVKDAEEAVISRGGELCQVEGWRGSISTHRPPVHSASEYVVL